MARRSLGLLALSILAAGCAAGPESESPSDQGEGLPDAVQAADVAPDAIHDKWFVELEEPPLVEGGDPARHAAGRERLRAHLAANRITVLERYTFDRLWHGVSMYIDHRAAEGLRGLPGVKAVYPVVPVYLDAAAPAVATSNPTTGPQATGGGAPAAPDDSSPDLATAIAMTGANVAQSSLGLTGAGVRVGVIDSGIDIHHPDLGGNAGGCFGPGCRVAFGYDFVGDAYDSSTNGALPIEDAIPDDCGGHGSHVAGIIGANGALKGVAPGVTFGAYRVFGCGGTTDADIMVKAMEMAEADGMRVVNMSIGSPFQWPGYPTALAADRLVAKGVVVVASNGNSGNANGLGPVWAAGAPGVGKDVIGVGSIDNTHVASPAFTLSDSTKIGWNQAAGAPAPPLSGTRTFVTYGTPTTTNDMCNAATNKPAAGSLTASHVVLIRRGTCAFREKTLNALAAGAGAVVFYNNVTGALTPTVVGTPAISIPVVAITAADGATIYNRIAAGGETLTWTTLTVTVPNPTGGAVSTFSSWGLAHDLSLKPDLSAPGGSIYSTYPLELGGYASLNGTSMASPHVAGAAALLIQAQPEIPAWQVRDALQNTAGPVAWSGDLTGATPDAVPRQGAGMIHIDVAAQAKVVVSPGKLSLGESQAGPTKATLTFTNRGATAVTYDAAHVAAASTDASYWTPTLSSSNPAAVSFNVPAVTVPAGGQASVDVTITANAAQVDGAIYGGYLTFTPQGGGATLRVPYAGFKGDYQALQILTPVTGKGYPWLAKYVSGAYTNQPSGATFTLQNGDYPYVVMHLERPAERLKVDVVDAVKGKPYGNVVDYDLVGQATNATATYPVGWNGTTTFNKQPYKVPNGTYKLVVSALKALGDPNNPAHWETWTSPVLTLNHP